jgi:hypothetical protein
MLACLLVFEAMAWAHDPMMNAWMNEHVGEDLRATVLSVRGIAFTLGGSARARAWVSSAGASPGGVGRRGRTVRRLRACLHPSGRLARNGGTAASVVAVGAK